MNSKNMKISIIGLGYVGLPLAISFAKKFDVIGFDTNKNRINKLKKGIDETLEISKKKLSQTKNLKFTNDINELKIANCYIITVPTPIDKFKKPDLKYLISASKLVGVCLKKNDLVIYESTVYPGATEEICVPILQKFSKLKFNKEFFVGYSPERINPGDKKHTVENIVKVTSGSNQNVANLVDNLYKKIIKAGTHKTRSIKIAEAAKVIENTQRDINISLMNELSLIFSKLKIDTEEVLEAAGTKWNFLPFRPGLVGGHCIGVDPYYLTYKSKQLGYKPKIILSGRKLNDNMSKYLAKKLIFRMKEKKIKIQNSKILFMGLTFKENCTDTRNSKIFDMINYLENNKLKISVFDPWVKKGTSNMLKKINLITKPRNNFYDCVVLAVGHNLFKQFGIKKIKKFTKKNHIIFDLKYLFPKKHSDLRM